MALSAATVWEVRVTNGSDTNGGGFVAGGSGTDYSQQDTAQLTVTDAACTGNTTVTSATGGFTAAMVDNCIYLSSGPGWYRITARTDTNTITIDRNGPNATGMTANVGGALKSLTTLAPLWVGSNKAFVKAESGLTQTATPTFVGGVTPSATVPSSRLIGYTSTRGDGGRVSITLSTNSGLSAIKAVGGFYIENFDINCSSLTTSVGIDTSNTNIKIRNCKISNFTSCGIKAQLISSLEVSHCEITGGTSAATGAIDGNSGSGLTIWNNYIHDNSCPGIGVSPNGSRIIGNVITNNTGSTSDGIALATASTGGMCVVWGNVIYGNGRHAISLSSGDPGIIRNNIIANHTGGSAAGLRCATAGLPADPRWDGNFYYNNTANRSNMDDTSTNAVNGVSPYTNTLDVSLSANPFTNAGSNDWTLNNTAGGGAAVRGKGYPGIGGTLYSGLPGLSSLTGYLDGGVFQHQDAGGASQPVGQACQ